MITEKDLQEAIAECQGVKNPTSSTCIKLAAYLTILNSMKEPEREIIPLRDTGYSYSPPSDAVFHPVGKSDFEKLINGKPIDTVLPEIVSLVEAVQVVNPRLYNSFIARL